VSRFLSTESCGQCSACKDDGLAITDVLDRIRGADGAANRPALLDVVVTPEAVSSDAKTGLAWVPDLQPLAAWDKAERTWRGG